MARNDEHILDKIATSKLLCSKSKFRAYFTVLPIDGQNFIVERAFLDYLAQKQAERAEEPSRIILPAGVSL